MHNAANTIFIRWLELRLQNLTASLSLKRNLRGIAFSPRARISFLSLFFTIRLFAPNILLAFYYVIFVCIVFVDTYLGSFLTLRQVQREETRASIAYFLSKIISAWTRLHSRSVYYVPNPTDSAAVVRRRDRAKKVHIAIENLTSLRVGNLRHKFLKNVCVQFDVRNRE